METIGQKLKEIRKRKGLTQEELAEEAKVNLRTIQRIENNSSEPRGTTLNLICEVLEVNLEEILDYGKTEDNGYLVTMHLTVLAFLLIPLGNIIFPLLLWLNKKDKIVNAKLIGTKILNFQILWTLMTFTSITCFAFLKIMHYSISSIFIYLAIFLYAINLILPIAFAIQIKKGNAKANYPQWIRILK